MLNLNDMVLFADVMEHGGFSAASRVLGMPKSSISRKIANLEKQLSVQLMHRSTRKLSLTPDGENFLRHCRDMRQAARHAFESVSRAQSEPRGTVRMSAPITLALSTLAQELPVFMDRYPKVQVDVQALNRPVDPMVEGIDLALRVRQQIEDSTSLVARTLNINHSILVCNPRLVQQHGPFDSPQDLDRLDTVAMSVRNGRSNWLLHGPDGARYTHAHTPCYVADDLHMLLCAAVHGRGLAVLPEYLCRQDLQSGKLQQLLPEWGPPPGIIHAVFPAGRTQVPAVRCLLDFLTEALSGEGKL